MLFCIEKTMAAMLHSMFAAYWTSMYVYSIRNKDCDIWPLPEISHIYWTRGRSSCISWFDLSTSSIRSAFATATLKRSKAIQLLSWIDWHQKRRLRQALETLFLQSLPRWVFLRKACLLSSDSRCSWRIPWLALQSCATLCKSGFSSLCWIAFC